uniref:(northern house mosquito) hypothetical protein n=1 Tax=Culex pipiens TaxID=7175 RepID=A0A8D8HV96_CULPI
MEFETESSKAATVMTLRTVAAGLPWKNTSVCVIDCGTANDFFSGASSSLKPSLAENNSSLLDRFGFRKIRRQRDGGGTVLSESELEPQQAVLAKRTEDVRMTTR